MHDVRSGHPLPAIVACKMLEIAGRSNVADIVQAMAAASYAHGRRRWPSSRPGRRPVDLDARDRTGRSPTPPPIRWRWRGRARDRALDLSVFVQYPEQFLPVPFFSELPRELFPAAVQVVAPGARRRRRRW